MRLIEVLCEVLKNNGYEHLKTQCVIYLDSHNVFPMHVSVTIVLYLADVELNICGPGCTKSLIFSVFDDKMIDTILHELLLIKGMRRESCGR